MIELYLLQRFLFLEKVNQQEANARFLAWKCYGLRQRIKILTYAAERLRLHGETDELKMISNEKQDRESEHQSTLQDLRNLGVYVEKSGKLKNWEKGIFNRPERIRISGINENLLNGSYSIQSDAIHSGYFSVLSALYTANEPGEERRLVLADLRRAAGILSISIMSFRKHDLISPNIVSTKSVERFINDCCNWLMLKS